MSAADEVARNRADERVGGVGCGSTISVTLFGFCLFFLGVFLIGFAPFPAALSVNFSLTPAIMFCRIPKKQKTRFICLQIRENNYIHRVR